MASKSIEQIKERLSIADVISSYIKLDPAGSNFKGRCPFHNEKTPSFMVSPDRASYYCFGCHAKGDIFTFVQEFEKVDFKEALKILADRAGVVLETYHDGHGDQGKKEEDEKDRLRNIMEVAASYFESELSKNVKAIEYLKSRGLEDKTIKEWRLGYAKEGWNYLYDYLISLGHKVEDIEKAGLIKKGDHGYYDRFRSRIMFPIFDPAGKVIAFTGRDFTTPPPSASFSLPVAPIAMRGEPDRSREDASRAGGGDVHVQAKYLNSPDTPLFDKSKTLYGFNKAKAVIGKWKFSLLVEGQMDLLMAHQAGYQNTVATSGTALTKYQIEMLSRFSKNILIAYDGDKAGVEAARRAWVLSLSLGMDVKMAAMPLGKDPADLIKEDLPAWKEAVRKGIHIVEFYLQALISRRLSPREMGKEVEREILPYVKAIESPIDQAHFISLISSRTDIKESVLVEAVKKVSTVPLQNSKIDDTVFAQQHSSKNRLIAGTYLLLNDEEKAKAYIENAVDIKEELMFTVEEWLGKSKQSKESYLSDLLKSLEKDDLQNDLKEALKNYYEAEREGDDAKSKEFLKKSDDIRKELAKRSLI